MDECACWLPLRDGSVSLASLSVETEQRLAQHPDEELRGQAMKLLADSGRLAIPTGSKFSNSCDRWPNSAGILSLARSCSKKIVLNAIATEAWEEMSVLISPAWRPGNASIFSRTSSIPIVRSKAISSNTRSPRPMVECWPDCSRPRRGRRSSYSTRRRTSKSSCAKTSTRWQARSGRSCPKGLRSLPPNDLVNLLEFLTARGRFFPLPLDKASTAISTVGMFYDHAATPERLIFPDWKPRTLCDVPFYPIDPRDDRVRNVVMLYGPQGTFPPQMPKSVSVPCNATAKAIYLLSGVSGWGYPGGKLGSLTMIVRLVYADKQIEDHPLLNGEHFADYIRHVDVPGSKFAAAITRPANPLYHDPSAARHVDIEHIELIKGDDATARHRHGRNGRISGLAIPAIFRALLAQPAV